MNIVLSRSDKMRLSIITVNYNDVEGLQRTIDSVLCQTWKDFEWIIIDGGSTDGSKELIEKYSECFSFWCSEPDDGAYNAMNKGIQHAKGEYLSFMNSGDVFYSEITLENVFNSCFHEDFVYGDWVRIEDESEVLMHAPDKTTLDFFYDDNICHQAMFIKTSIMKREGFDESYTAYADWARWIKILLDDGSTKYLQMVICRFDARGGLSNRNLSNLNKEKERVRNVIPFTLRELIINYNKLKDTLESYEKSVAVRETYTLTSERPIYNKMIRLNILMVSLIKRVIDLFCK